MPCTRQEASQLLYRGLGSLVTWFSSGALERAFGDIKKHPDVPFGVAAARGGGGSAGRCAVEVEGYLVGSAAWSALQTAVHRQPFSPPPA
jgi:hypothetical protein